MSSQPKDILVTGATGNVGSVVVTELLARGHRVRAGLATGRAGPLTAGRLPAGVAPVEFDFGEPRTWGPALDGVQAVFLLRPPAITDVARYLFPVIEAARAGGVGQIVFLSLQGVAFNPLTPHFKVERYLKRTGAPYTFLRPNFYLQNLSTFYAEDVALRNEIFLPAGRGRTAFVDVRDIGAVAAVTMSEPGHVGKAYTLTGPEALNYYEVAATMSSVLGRPITYAEPSVDEYVARLRARGADPDYIKVQKMLYFVVRHNLSAGVRRDVLQLLGRPATPLQQFVRDHRNVWEPA